MGQNLYMDDENLRLNVEVQPFLIDEIEDKKNIVERCAASITQSTENINTLKTNFELFYADAYNTFSGFYNQSLEIFTSAKNNAINSLNTLTQQLIGSIREIGQNIINQIQIYADQVSDTVNNNVSFEYLNQSKCGETGDISDDSHIISFIKKYAHSTFDKSKFTVIGSPILTDDGIASGFSVYTDKISNDTLTNISASQLSTDGNWSFKCRFTLPSTNPNRGEIPIRIPYGAYGFIFVDSNHSTIYIQPYGTVIRSISDSGFAWGSTYDIEVIFNGANSKVKAKKDGVSLADNPFTLPTTPLAFGGTQFSFGTYGSDNANYKSFSGSIDLKQFSITVDGVEVFSGNKTGIDTIKADDYTVVDTPTISVDGLLQNGAIKATGVKSEDFYNKDFEFEFQFKTLSTLPSTSMMLTGDGNNPVNGAFQTYYNAGGSLNCAVFEDVDGTSTKREIVLTRAWKANETYTVKYKRVGNTITYSRQGKSEATAVTGTITLSNPLISNNKSLRIYTNNIVLQNVDLNSVKLFVDGDLVYQPCLKIPYTQSKTGSKIVNSIYRDRVIDMYDEFGYAPYYTLSDTDFTLPMGEVYGMMEKYKANIIQILNQ